MFHLEILKRRFAGNDEKREKNLWKLKKKYMNSKNTDPRTQYQHKVTKSNQKVFTRFNAETLTIAVESIRF